MISVESLLKMRNRLFKVGDDLLIAKGNDYNFKEQMNGDTLANLRAAARMGLVDSEMRSVLIRITEKIMRLKSFCEADFKQKVSDESVEDTCVDLINYATYYLAFYKERAGVKIE